MTARKPQALKIISGTDQPSRRLEGVPFSTEEPLVEVPVAPDWLPNAHALKEWGRLAPILVANKLLTESSLQTLGVLCAVYGKIVQLYAAGESPVASQLAQYRGLAAEFGLTPMAQAKLKPSSEPERKNRFSGHGKRPNA